MKRTLAAPQFAHYPGEWHLSPVLDTGDFLFLSGQTGWRPDDTVAADPEEQFRDVFISLEANLAAAGLSFDNVVEMTSYHIELKRHLQAFVKVKDEYVTAPYPAWTAIGVSEFISDGTLVEVRVIARRG